MSGKYYTILPKITYNFFNLGTGLTATIPVGEPIYALDYTDVVLIVRVHALDVGSNGVISFSVYPDGFLDNSSAFPGLTPVMTCFPAGTVPFCRTAGALVYSEWVSVALTAQRLAAGTISITASVEVLLRSPDDSFSARETRAALQRGYPVLAAVAPVFAVRGLDIDSVEIVQRNLPPGVTAQTLSADTVALSPEFLSNATPRQLAGTLAHELTHIMQIRRLGFQAAHDRASAERSEDGFLGARYVGPELRNRSFLELDVVDPRYTLESIGARIGQAVEQMVPEFASRGQKPCGCANAGCGCA